MQKIPVYWVDVPGSVRYQVSNYGNFRRRLKNGSFKAIKTYIKHDKWYVIKVDFKGRYAEYVVHTIVAAAFLDDPLPGQVLMHKNGLKFDNYAGNLEWLTRHELGKRTGFQSNSIPVVQLDLASGKIINFYKSIKAAAKENYISAWSICSVLKGKQKTAAGYGWRKEQYDDFLQDEAI